MGTLLEWNLECSRWNWVRGLRGGGTRRHRVHVSWVRGLRRRGHTGTGSPPLLGQGLRAGHTGTGSPPLPGSGAAGQGTRAQSHRLLPGVRELRGGGHTRHRVTASLSHTAPCPPCPSPGMGGREAMRSPTLTRTCTFPAPGRVQAPPKTASATGHTSFPPESHVPHSRPERTCPHSGLSKDFQTSAGLDQASGREPGAGRCWTPGHPGSSSGAHLDLGSLLSGSRAFPGCSRQL